jgi:hypothetical protein
MSSDTLFLARWLLGAVLVFLTLLVRRAYLAAGAVGVILLTMYGMCSGPIIAYLDLPQFRDMEIVRIDVGDVSITDAQKIREIREALAQADFSTGKVVTLGPSVPVEMTRTRGRQLGLRFASHGPSGAVAIGLYDATALSMFARSRQLARILSDCGVVLPMPPAIR